MSDGATADRLGSSRHCVGVLRLLVEASGKFSGVLVPDNQSASYHFVGPSGLTAAVEEWLGDGQQGHRSQGPDPSRAT